METKFTKGPWEVRRNRQGSINGAAIKSQIDQTRIGTISPKADKPIEQKEADAHLIASSPDLYGALAYCLERLRDIEDEGLTGFSINEAENRAEAALARARGETA